MADCCYDPLFVALMLAPCLCRDNYNVELVNLTSAGHLYDTMQTLHTTDVFMGMHGAGMANIMWLPPVRVFAMHSCCISTRDYVVMLARTPVTRISLITTSCSCWT